MPPCYSLPAASEFRNLPSTLSSILQAELTRFGSPDPFPLKICTSRCDWHVRSGIGRPQDRPNHWKRFFNHK